jgi:general secretion pathway protein K
MQSAGVRGLAIAARSRTVVIRAAADTCRPEQARTYKNSGACFHQLPFYRRQAGAALLLVLWLIALLTALIGGFATTARVEYLQGRVLARGLVAEQAARAGIEYALVRLAEQDPRLLWQPDGRPYHWRFGEAQVEIRTIDEQGKVDLNAAQPPLLTALLRTFDVEQQQAARLAGAIVDWRDPDDLTQPAGGGEDGDYEAAGLPYGAKDAPFDTTAELLQVLGMTPQLYAQLAPHLTVFSGRDMPEATFASAPVLTAMGLDARLIVEQRQRWSPASGQPPPLLPGGLALQGSAGGTYSIWSRARLRDGREALLRVVVRSGGTGLPGMAYLPLQWEEGTSLR